MDDYWLLVDIGLLAIITFALLKWMANLSKTSFDDEGNPTQSSEES